MIEPNRIILNSPWYFIALGAGSGLLPAPGTCASIFTTIIFLFLHSYLNTLINFLIFMILTIVGTLAVKKTDTALRSEDHPSIVIDEIAAMWLILFLAPMGHKWQHAFILLILFRLFDIFKPPPIRQIDSKLKNSVGVMLDDIVAAIMVLFIYFLFLAVQY